nr:VOC family protein [Ochrobactrum sp. CM-21-5]
MYASIDMLESAPILSIQTNIIGEIGKIYRPICVKKCQFSAAELSMPSKETGIQQKAQYGTVQIASAAFDIAAPAPVGNNDCPSQERKLHMSHPVKGVDHVFLLVNDLEKSAEQYRRLGFTLSPRGVHSKEKGTGNYTIMFGNDYFELLGIVAQTVGNLHQREKLVAQGEGLHAVACRIDNAREAKSDLNALGIKTSEVGAFSRPVQLPNGDEGIAAFETVHFVDSEVPQGMVFMCQHKTRNTVWIPELIQHPNGANALSAIVAISDDPENTAKGFSHLFANGKMKGRDDGWKVTTGEHSADLLVLAPEKAAEIYPGIDFTTTPASAFAVLRIRVNSIEQVRGHLEANSISWINTDSGIAVLPQNASGAVIEFVG